MKHRSTAKKLTPTERFALANLGLSFLLIVTAWGLMPQFGGHPLIEFAGMDTANYARTIGAVICAIGGFITACLGVLLAVKALNESGSGSTHKPSPAWPWD